MFYTDKRAVGSFFMVGGDTRVKISVTINHYQIIFETNSSFHAK